MTTKNSITGDKIKSKPNSAQYRSNFDAIFKKPKRKVMNPPVITKNTSKIKKVVRNFHVK